MKRAPVLIPLSHDHHHALVAARRLRRAAGGADAREEAAAFSCFFADESVRHFREEEERLFPLVADSEEARPLVVRALLVNVRGEGQLGHVSLDRWLPDASSSG